MVKLIATDPFKGKLPLTGGGVTVEAHDPGPLNLIMVGRGGTGKVAGLTFPDPGRVSVKEAARLMWMGPGQALLMGAQAPDLPDAEPVDQTDAWALARVVGEAGPEVLARLVPVDLRLPEFQVGHTARSLIGHMTGSVTRIDDQTLEVMVMRSMAGTLVHDLERAMRTSER